MKISDYILIDEKIPDELLEQIARTPNIDPQIVKVISIFGLKIIIKKYG